MREGAEGEEVNGAEGSSDGGSEYSEVVGGNERKWMRERERVRRMMI